MLYFRHESAKFGTQRGYQRRAADPGKASSGGVDWNKNCCATAGFGGPAAGTNKRFVRVKPHGFGALDSWSESGWNPSRNTKASARSPNSANACYEATVGAPPLMRKTPCALWRRVTIFRVSKGTESLGRPQGQRPAVRNSFTILSCKLY